MKHLFFFLSIIIATVTARCDNGYPIDQVPFTAVKLHPGFWNQRLEAAREVTVPLAFSKCQSEGRYRNFERAAEPCDTFTVDGFSFDDTDVYKTIEGASYLMSTFPDPAMDRYIDSILTIVAAAQEPDGYLYTARTQNPAHPHPWAGSERWVKVEELSHEFYNLGHMVDAAVAHYQATGKTNFLDIARRYADCICRYIGPADDQLHLVPGHQIAEMALARLYLATGEHKYLDQARYFLDLRGHTSRRDSYSQAHKPVTEQDEAVGHAVRAAYMYAGMADVAALTADSAYIAAIDRIWDNIVNRKLYITGGIGATHQGEAFGANYELPNLTAYCETCAAIGNVYVNHRLFLLHGDARYYDVLERTLYNGVISGMSIDGGRFFYPNPLASDGNYEREPWFGCACCPSNLCRFIPSVPGYIYAHRDNNIYVNLFTPSTATINLDNNDVTLTQSTGYPYDGNIKITVDQPADGRWAMKLRIPGWARGEVVPGDLYSYADELNPEWQVTVNGKPVERTLDKGYITINRDWKAGDSVVLSIDMPARAIQANEAVEADRGLIAWQRGPLVYCAEQADNATDISALTVSPMTQPVVEDFNQLPGVAKSLKLAAQSPDGLTEMTLIPYYAWCHRGPNKMSVWLPRSN